MSLRGTSVLKQSHRVGACPQPPKVGINPTTTRWDYQTSARNDRGQRIKRQNGRRGVAKPPHRIKVANMEA